MRNLFLVTFSIVTFFIVKGYSQVNPCSSSEFNKRAEQLNPEAIPSKIELEKFTKDYINNNTKTEEVYIIPVVFHVMHNYGAENISRDQILDAIRVLNNDFRKLNPDTINIIPEFTGIAADSRIEFRLATIDPDGNCTDGIVRVVTPSTYYGDENTKMESPAWPREKYLNIWTVESIASGAAGYSYYPSSVAGAWGEDVDGVLVLYDYVGSIWPSSSLTSRTLTHEVGHYLNLPHPWGSSNEPGLLSNCSMDDGVSDTPNTIGHTSCSLYSESCGSLDNVQNYMEYSYCTRMFTEGQKQRMRAALNSTVSGRSNLWSVGNLIATGTNDGAVAQTCFPMPDFTSSGQFGCENFTVQFTDITWNTDTITSRLWTFQGGFPSTSTNANPVVEYFNEGVYDVTLSVTNQAGTNQITHSSFIHIQNPAFGESVPWTEGFENNGFPIHPTDNAKNWEIVGDAFSNWQRLNGVSTSGQACVFVDNTGNTTAQSSTLLSPNILMAGNNPGSVVTFKVAYAQKDVNSNDKLYVFFSYNCGQSWFLKYNKYGANLSTNGGNYVNSFTPNSSEWRDEIINLNSLQNKPYLRIKFVATSGEGNGIFIDDVNLQQATGIEEYSLSDQYNLSVFPNPIDKDSKIVFELTEKAEVVFELYDIVGKQIAKYAKQSSEGYSELNFNRIFNRELTQGIYFMKAKIDGKTETIKLMVD